MMRTLRSFRLFSITLIPLVGVLSFLSKATPDPDQSLQQFVKVFTAGNVAGLKEMLDPDVMTGKEIESNEVENFVQRYHRGPLVLEAQSIDRRMKSEDEKTERFQATVAFRATSPAPRYADPCKLTMVLLWVLHDDRWWLERPLSIHYTVTSSEVFPTDAQRESAMRFESARGVLERLGLKDDQDLAIIGRRAPGSAANDYAQLEKLHEKERDKKGIDPDCTGVGLLLRAAGKEHGGFLQIYHGDFREGAKDKRKPMPWEALRDYVAAALARGKTEEKRASPKVAEKIYRQVIAVGRQLVDEPGGYSFLNWGMTFQKQGAQELARLLSSAPAEERQKVAAFANLVSRRLDSLQTALACLDDFADYRALEAAMSASKRADDAIFRPWALNTLTIFSLKGAPAGAEAMQAAGGLVLVKNTAMQKMAAARLDELLAKEGGKTKEFIDAQRAWVQTHNVYGEGQSFR